MAVQQQSRRIQTNPKRGSVASCSTTDIVTATFKALWANYVKGSPYSENGKVPKDFENQCTIRMSANLHKI